MNKHICLYCTSPCALTLAFTSEGCTNPRCQAYAAPEEQPIIEKPDAELAGAFLCNNGPQGQRCELCEKKLAGGRRFNMNTETGRLSSKGPNYSNRPRPDYVPFFEHSPASPLLDKNGTVVGLAAYDIHTRNAVRMYGVPPEQVTPEQRRNAKTVFYAKLYGNLSGSPSLRAMEERVDSALKQINAKITVDPTYLLHARELPALQPGKETKDCPGCEMEDSQKKRAAIYEEQAALWPNTMRVLARGEDRKLSYKDKTGSILAGVLSLVEVPAKYGGRYAIYDYVAFAEPQSARCRIRAWRVGSQEHWQEARPRFQKSDLGVSNHSFRASLAFADLRDEEKLKEHHLPAILDEFTEHAALKRNPRRLTLGEKMIASAIRAGKRL